VIVLNKSQTTALKGKYKNYVSYGFDATSSDINKIKEGGIGETTLTIRWRPSPPLSSCARGGFNPEEIREHLNIHHRDTEKNFIFDGEKPKTAIFRGAHKTFR
jgi:hypothetical protein